MNIIQHCIKQAIHDNPQAAAREVPKILGHYIVNNKRLNRVYQAAKCVVLQPDKFALEQLAQAVREAECH